MLELLVVLVLVGLVTALALPNLERFQAAAVRRTERDHILDQIAGLGRRAMLDGRTYVVFGTGRAWEDGRPGGADAAPGSPGQGDRIGGPPSWVDHERHVLDLPEGWEVRLDEPLVVHANGVCLGARLTLAHQGMEGRPIVLDPPFCRIGPDPDA